MTDALFHGTIENRRITDWITTFNSFGDEAVIQLGENGWRATVKDAANVAFSDAMLDNSAFAEYELNTDEYPDGFAYGVDIDRLKQVIGMAESGTAVEFTFDSIHSAEIVAGGVSYSLQGINADKIPTVDELPAMDHTFHASPIDADELKRAVTACEMVSNEMRFLADSDDQSFDVVSRGDTDDVEVDLVDACESIKADEDVEAIYSVEYCKNLVASLPSNATLGINLKSDYPLHVSIEAGDGYVQSDIMLAPRLEE